MQKIIFYLFLFVFFYQFNLFAEEETIPEDAKLVKLEIKYDQAPIVVQNDLGEDKIAIATIRGKIITEGHLQGGTADCRIVGYAAPGRAFSCGFAQVENIDGYCILKNENDEGLVAKLTCSSATNGNGGVSCQGRLDFLSGSGKFAGISGKAKINMSQIFSSEDNFLNLDGFWKLPALLLSQSN